jgi:hypothetical protein
VSDLTPLKGMPLNVLHTAHTRVSDLTPLKGMPLNVLHAEHTRVSDLTPLKGLPLTGLSVAGSRVTDLTPVRELALTLLTCDFQPQRDTEILRSVKTLETINGKPAADLLKGTRKDGAMEYRAEGTADYFKRRGYQVADLRHHLFREPVKP